MPILDFFILDPAGQSGNGDFDGFGGAPISIDSGDNTFEDIELVGTDLEGGTISGVATVTLDGVEYQLVQVLLGGEEYYADIGGADLDALGTIRGLVTTLDGSTFTGGSGVAVCFARGSMIRTERGETPVEALEVGDLVCTVDHGLQPLRWIGSNTVSTNGALAPILIKAGALEDGMPAIDLRVSPKHRVLVSGWKAELLFGEPEVLVTADSLINDRMIARDRSAPMIQYYHMLFDSHELVWANGSVSESFHPTAAALENISDETRTELFDIFPELACESGTKSPVVRASAGGCAANGMAEEVKRLGIPL